MKKVDIITALIAVCILAVLLWFATMDIGNNTERLDSMEQKISQLEEQINHLTPRPWVLLDDKGEEIK